MLHIWIPLTLGAFVLVACLVNTIEEYDWTNTIRIKEKQGFFVE